MRSKGDSVSRGVVATDEYLAMLRRLIRAAGRRVATVDPEDLAELVRLRQDLDDAIVVAVKGQRASGITWESIGEATGTTRQGAIMKWAKKVGP